MGYTHMDRGFAISLLLLVGLSRVSPAFAQESRPIGPVRAERRVLLGVGLVYPMVLDHDVTIPLPSLRLAVNISPRLVVELSAGSMPYAVSGRWTLIDAGVRWQVADGPLSPYLMAHIGKWFDEADEGYDGS